MGVSRLINCVAAGMRQAPTVADGRHESCPFNRKHLASCDGTRAGGDNRKTSSDGLRLLLAMEITSG